MKDVKNYLRSSCQTAATLLLSAPSDQQTELINQLTGQHRKTDEWSASFENLFLLPGSSHYVPVHEHVLNASRKNHGVMEFPVRLSAEAGAVVAEKFDERGFQWRDYVRDLPTVGGTSTADHEGLILLFIAGLAEDEPPSEEDRAFVRARLPAIKCLEEVLTNSPDPYASVVTTSLNEARKTIVEYFQLL